MVWPAGREKTAPSKSISGVMVMKILRLGLLMLMVGLVSLALMGSGAQLEKLRVMGVTWPGLGPAYIALEKGFWQDLGLEVELQIVDDLQVNNSVWRGGHFDIRYFTVDTLAFTAANFSAIVFLRTDASRGGDKAIGIREIEDIPDIKGHSVTFAEASPQHFFLLYLLEREGISLSEVKQVPLGDIALSAVAFQRGEVDAAMTWPPFDSIALERPGSHILITTADIEEDILPAIFLAQPELARGRPDLLKKFTDGWWQAMEFLEEHPEEALEIMARGLQIPAEELKFALLDLVFSDVERNCQFFGLGRLAPEEGAVSEFEWLFDLASRLWLESTLLQEVGSLEAVQDKNLLHFIFGEDCS